MVLALFESLLTLFAAAGFGYAIALGDLVEREGYRWFRGAGLAIGAAAAALGLATMWLSMDAVRLFFLAALASWLLLGRLFAPGKLAMTVVVGAYLAHGCLTADNLDVRALIYFAVTLLLTGGAALIVNKRADPPAWAKQLLQNERWAWIAIVGLYAALFELDLSLITAVWAFTSGRAALDDDAARSRLVSWGIKPPAFHRR